MYLRQQQIKILENTVYVNGSDGVYTSKSYFELKEDNKMSCNKNCNGCNRIIKSTGISVVAGILQVAIPTTIFNNESEFCLVLAQTLPVGSSFLHVNILNNATVINLIDKNGNLVTGDQLKCRKRYNVVFGSNSVVPHILIKNCLPSPVII